jgi:putative transposase
MAHKYLVDLTEEERGYLLNLISKGKPAARRVARAHVLLHAAEGATDDEVAQALHLGTSTVHRTRQRFVDEGLLPALSERRRPGQRPALTGNQAAFLVALACSTPPAGRRRWTLRLLADRLIELQQVESISHDTVGRVLKKTTSNRGNVKSGVFRASVPLMSGTWKTSWICMPSPMILVTLKYALTKVRCN